jgi:chemotaxis protein CheC
MQDQETFDESLLEILQIIAGTGIHDAAQGFSSLLGHRIDVSEPQVKLVPLLDIPKIVGGVENQAIGIYLRGDGDISVQIMLIIPFNKAFELVDLLLELPYGSTQQLGTLERSALGEVGNLTGTFFLNAMAKITHSTLKPTPPAVIVDMVGAILDIIIATSGGVSDQVMMIQAKFMDGERSVETNFWVIPDISMIQAFNNRSAVNHE